MPSWNADRYLKFAAERCYRTDQSLPGYPGRRANWGWLAVGSSPTWEPSEIDMSILYFMGAPVQHSNLLHRKGFHSTREWCVLRSGSFWIARHLATSRFLSAHRSSR